MIIQIYAFTKLEEAVAAVNMGVDNVGFVAGLYDMVYGELSFADARAMADAIPAGGNWSRWGWIKWPKSEND